jgi:hypothetical protein
LKLAQGENAWWQALAGDQAGSKEFQLCISWRRLIDLDDLLDRLKLEPQKAQTEFLSKVSGLPGEDQSPYLSQVAKSIEIEDKTRLKLVHEVLKLVTVAIKSRQTADLKRLVKAVEALDCLTSGPSDPLRLWMLETFRSTPQDGSSALRSLTIGELREAASAAGFQHEERQLRRVFQGLGGVLKASKPGRKPKPNC